MATAMGRRFSAEVHRRGEVMIVKLVGDIDHEAEPALSEAWAKARASELTTVLLSFEQVGYVNSTGIALIVQILAEARSSAVTVRACGLSEHFRHIFEITRLADFVNFYPDEEAATGRDVVAPRS